MDILQKVDIGISFTELSKMYNVCRSTIYDIRKNRHKIESFVKTLESEVRKRQTMKPGEYPELEEVLFSCELIELETKNYQLDKDFILERCEERFESSQPYLTDDELLTLSCSKPSDACSEDLSGIEDTTDATVKSKDALNGLDVAIKWRKRIKVLLFGPCKSSK
ncbi:hypothetical protein ABEB36_008373 [Hypothenemus hampei]|uniref:HTH psq-type domain-containing protein n=1 Tax=Hypothenemus hampei TaxID=57062 RepID=A0ABD1ELM2_HYPHA